MNYLFIFFYVILTALSKSANADEYEISPISCDKATTRAEQFICIVPEISDIDAVNSRVYFNFLKELEFRLKIKKPKEYEFLKQKVVSSEKTWITYRDSFCDLETLHISNEDENNEYYKQCLFTLIKNRTEELRIIQFNFRELKFK